MVECKRRNNLQVGGSERRITSKWLRARGEIICKWTGAREEKLVNGGEREEK
jgi:hypothetical protein